MQKTTKMMQPTIATRKTTKYATLIKQAETPPAATTSARTRTPTNTTAAHARKNASTPRVAAEASAWIWRTTRGIVGAATTGVVVASIAYMHFAIMHNN